jgi:dephospho-CoA kinase
VLRVGLTGGIGSGKSEVARLLARQGAYVVDSDALARAAVAPGTPGLAAVVEAFGPGVLRADGSLDRERLAAIVFDDAAARERLNAIVHPLVGAAAAAAVVTAPPGAVVVHDVPLLVETGMAPAFDVVVVVDAPDDIRLARLTGRRGMDRADAQRRMAAQATRQERLAVASYVITNDGTLDELADRVGGLWQDLVVARADRSATPT